MSARMLCTCLVFALAATWAQAADRPTDSRVAYIDYLAAGNLARQGALKEALRYYRSAMQADPQFTEAMHDAALIYARLEDWEPARQVIDQAIKVAGDDPILHHARGEILQAEGFARLRARDQEAGLQAVHEAVQSYGKAIEVAEEHGELAARAPTYFRLGEILYRVYGDVASARRYWQQVLRLHAPAPHRADTPQEVARRTRLRTRLRTWQRWTEAHLRQLGDAPSAPPVPPQEPSLLPAPDGQPPALPPIEEEPAAAPIERAQTRYEFWDWPRHR